MKVCENFLYGIENNKAAVTISCKVTKCSGTSSLDETVITKTKHGKRTVVTKKLLALASAHFSVSKTKSKVAELRLTALGEKVRGNARRHPVKETLELNMGSRTSSYPVTVN